MIFFYTLIVFISTWTLGQLHFSWGNLTWSLVYYVHRINYQFGKVASLSPCLAFKMEKLGPVPVLGTEQITLHLFPSFGSCNCSPC